MIRIYRIILIIVSISYIISCKDRNTGADNFISVQVGGVYQLPGIPSEKTLFFNKGLLFYQCMNDDGSHAFKCYSLKSSQLVWSNNISQMGINKGAITATGEYIAPTLSDSVYVIDETGNYRILKLENRCKIDPIVYDSTFILQDRGIGLKSFDAKSLSHLWTIRQNTVITMTQPLLLDSNIVYVLDEKSIESSNALSGKLNWKTPVKDSLSIQILYGMHKNVVFILSTDLQKIKFITAINGYDGNQIWRQQVDSSIDVWERSMVVRNDILFCKGDKNILSYSVNDGRFLQKYKYDSSIATSLIVDGVGDLFFGTSNNALMKIDKNGKSLQAATLQNKPNELYSADGEIFLYSHPRLYSLHNSQ